MGNEVQSIVDFVLARRQMDDRSVQYLVRWKGHPPADDTWVSELDLDPVVRTTFDNLHPANGAQSSDLPGVSDSHAPFPPTFSVTGNIPDDSLSSAVPVRRARDWIGPAKPSLTRRCLLQRRR
mmetsp:Transcript_18950/g.36867  ORF Transcript_18950/g.36867 Transcript_18950/m.36867 type:complete len:123 (-) Transcript_18950:247-615(-)